MILDWDDGLASIDVASVRGPKTWPESLKLIESIGSFPSGHQSLILDTIDPLEDMATKHVCSLAKKTSLADFGYGAGYEALAAEWRLLLQALDACRDAGMTVMLLAHSSVKTVSDPTLGSYDMNLPQLQKKTWGATARWADCVFYACFDAARVGDERRAIVTGERIVHTTPGTGFTAKNRYGMPARLPLSWQAIAAAMQSGDTAEELRTKILELAGETYRERASGFIAEAGEDVNMLRSVFEALKEKVGT